LLFIFYIIEAVVVEVFVTKVIGKLVIFYPPNSCPADDDKEMADCRFQTIPLGRVSDSRKSLLNTKSVTKASSRPFPFGRAKPRL
jgi:hypothetical protein